MRVVALFRVSTEAQSSQGASLDAQERTFRELAVRHGWTTVAEFRGCESATQAASDRRVLQQALACIRDHSVDAIYVHEQSRLTRGDELEVALLMRELKERKLKIIVHGVVRDLNSIDERFMVGIQGLVDRAESERIKERFSRGKRERARQGKKTCGPAPYGYSNPHPGQPNRGTLQVVPEEAAIVRRIFERAASGAPVRAVSRELNSLGLAAPRGGKWGRSSVKRILDCPAYAGMSVAGGWVAEKGSRTFRFSLRNPNAIVVPNAHEPIVTKETWDAVNARARPASTAKPRMLTGLLFVNGARFRSDYSGSGKFYSAGRGVKGHPWLPSDDTDEAVWHALVKLATGEDFVARLLEAARRPEDERAIAAEIERLEAEVIKRRKREATWLEMRADGEIDRETYAEKVGADRAAIEAIQKELGELRGRLMSTDRTAAARVVRAVQMLLEGRTKLTTDQRRAALRAIVTRVDVAAEATGALPARDALGRVVGQTGPAWAIRSVALQLALPPGVEANGANVGRDRPEARSSSSCDRPQMTDGDRHLATTGSSCAQVTVTDRSRRLVTTRCNCVLVTVTVPVGAAA